MVLKVEQRKQDYKYILKKAKSMTKYLKWMVSTNYGDMEKVRKFKYVGEILILKPTKREGLTRKMKAVFRLWQKNYNSKSVILSGQIQTLQFSIQAGMPVRSRDKRTLGRRKQV